MDNLTLRATILLAGHGLLFSTLFNNVFSLDLLQRSTERGATDYRSAFVVAVFGTLSGFGMFADWRAVEKAPEGEHPYRFWLHRSLHMMYGLLIALVAVHWFYGWRYVDSLGLYQALLP